MDKKPGKVIKIALTGPESTGKTSLSAELAAYYKTTWVPEYSRDYLDGLDRPYTEEDLLKIAKGQRLLEKEKMKAANTYLFCDTDMFNMKIWSLHKYGRVHEKISEWVLENSYDLYLLCYPDLSWTPDTLRENPGEGDYFFHQFESELTDAGFPYVVVKGKGNKRLEAAVHSINQHFGHL